MIIKPHVFVWHEAFCLKTKNGKLSISPVPGGYDVKIVPDERGKVNMCDAIKGIKEDARNEGIETGTYDTLTILVNQGKLSVSDAADTVHLTVPEFIEKTGLKV